VRLYHFESKSRGADTPSKVRRTMDENRDIRERWPIPHIPIHSTIRI